LGVPLEVSFISAELKYDCGCGEQAICTDESWRARKNGAYLGAHSFDGRVKIDDFTYAEAVLNRWNCMDAPIPVRYEEELRPEGSVLRLAPYETKTVRLEPERISGGFVSVRAKTAGEIDVKVTCSEQEERLKTTELVFCGEQYYRGFAMLSAGNITVEAVSRSEKEAVIEVGFIKTHYPVSEEATTVTDDEDMNLVLDTCKHTLKICRQTHHLDSTRHCEPMACTGDYYIESLMTAFSFGDMRLAEFDLRRTALMLEREEGRMFHTTYSLIWVKMLWDVYMMTGCRSLLQDCERALELLLGRFAGYIGNNGLIETPPDYMFVDWIYIDGLSMHHPPKALGQSCLNMYYFGALESAEKIYTELDRQARAEDCRVKRAALRERINTLLFDGERGCYFEGLNTPTPEELIGRWMPQNVSKRYYLKHSNILAACFGVCDDETGRELIDKIMSEQIGGDVQPYFLHYLLEAVYRLGLREKYTVVLCEKWKASVRECPKGLVEGFVPPHKSKYPRLYHLFCVLRTNVLILITMLVFRAGSLSSALGMLGRICTKWGAAWIDSGFSPMQALCLGVCTAVLFGIEWIHEKRKTLTQITDPLPAVVRGALYLAAVMAIVIFGVWGPGYTAQAFIYFQF